MGPEWRQQMIARGASTLSVDEALANLTRNLDLTADQAAKIRPILQGHHDRILAILRSAPASLTRDEFTAQVHALSADTHNQINALLTPKQRDQVKALGTPARI
jgi:Spy/CpxP family protein refolding chaperone